MVRQARIIGVTVLLMAVAIVGACSSTVKREPIPSLSYGHLPPLLISVARIELVEEYQSPLKEPNLEHSFPTPPAVAFRRWVNDRLRAQGQSGALRVTIRDASAIRVPLPRTEGIEAFFTTDQVERVDSTLSVLLEVLDEKGGAEAQIEARAQRSRTLPEGLSLNERDKLYQEISESLVNDLNATIEQNMRQTLAKYLLS
jgi:hypothetical protein